MANAPQTSLNEQRVNEWCAETMAKALYRDFPNLLGGIKESTVAHYLYRLMEENT